MSRKQYKWILTVLALLLLALLTMVYSISSGELSVSFFKIPAILWNGEGSIEFTILKNIRLPRIILGMAVGGSLSLAGVILQGIYRNPLVEPYTLGISGGAALGVSLAIVFGIHLTLGAIILPVSGFLGALATVVFVYFFSVRNGRLLISNMVLTGVMISFIASSAMMFLMATTTSENFHGIIFWVMGSLDEPSTSLILLTVLVSFASLLGSYFFIQPLNALRMGEEKARHLGIDTDTSVKLLFLIASLLTGVCVSVCGVIGFVGLIVPHVLRLLVGSDFRILLVSSFITGGTFLIFCDTIARTIISPNELPIGVITGIIGGIVFIIIVSRTGRKLNVG